MVNWKRFAGICAALIILNASLSFHNIWPTPWIYLRPELSVEAAMVILLICTYTSAFKKSMGQRMRLCLLIFVLILVLGRYLDVTTPSLFGRPLDLYWDAQHVPRIVAMICDGRTTAFIFGIGALLLAGAACIAYTASCSLRFLCLSTETKRVRIALSCLSLFILGLYAAGMGNRSIQTERWFSIPVGYMYIEQLNTIYESLYDHTPVEIAAPAHINSDLGRLHGRDMYLFFVESYGSIVFDDGEFIPRLKPAIKTLDENMEIYGWVAATGLYESPTFGGASWLAHATLMTGNWTKRQQDYKALMSSKFRSLTTYFQEAGYRTVALMPGLKTLWPEGTFYKYDQIWNASQLKYMGPDFGWWRIPDQYSLSYLYDTEIALSDRPPLFVFFASISSHMPFTPLPPYEEDWSQVLSDSPYDIAHTNVDNSYLIEADTMRLAYERAINYEIHLLAGFLKKVAHQKPMIIVLGDHQPPAIVSGRNTPWLVPVHVFTQNTDLLEPFIDIGFRRGLLPPSNPLGRLSFLHKIILEGFDTRWQAKTND